MRTVLLVVVVALAAGAAQARPSTAPASRPSTAPASRPTRTIAICDIGTTKMASAVGVRVFGEVGIRSISPVGESYEVEVLVRMGGQNIDAFTWERVTREVVFVLTCDEETALGLRVGRELNIIGTIADIRRVNRLYRVYLRDVKAGGHLKRYGPG